MRQEDEGAASPAYTLRLLDELESLGFDDLAFSQLHHWRASGKAETIRSFRNYCLKHDEFHANGNNARVAQRLELVLKAFTLDGFASRNSAVFSALAEAAWLEVPVSPKK